jgi:hypothetical protein
MSRLKRKQSGTTTSAAIHISSHKQPTERTGEDSTDQRLRQITRYTSGFRASFQPVDISRSNDAIMIPISNLRSIPCLSFGARGNTRADAVRGRVALVRPATLSLISQLPKHTQVLLPLYSASYTRSSYNIGACKAHDILSDAQARTEMQESARIAFPHDFVCPSGIAPICAYGSSPNAQSYLYQALCITLSAGSSRRSGLLICPSSPSQWRPPMACVKCGTLARRVRAVMIPLNCSRL